MNNVSKKLSNRTSVWPRRLIRSGVALLQIALTTASLASPTSATEDTASITSSAPSLERQLVDIAGQNDVPGLALVVVDRSRITERVDWGFADLGSGREVNSETIFRVGSISKSITALSVLMAEQQQKLSLNEPLRRWLPNKGSDKGSDKRYFDNRFAASNPLTLAHLLEHTSGWHDMSSAEFSSADPTPLTLEQALAIEPLSRVSYWPPGHHHSYSNSGAGVAALVLELATETSFEQYVQREIFQPMKMPDSHFLLGETDTDRLALGYDRDGRSRIPYWHILYRPAGGMNATANDMARWTRMMLNDGWLDGKQIVPAKLIERMEQPQTTLAARRGLSYGYGAGVRQHTRDGVSFFGHSGDADGYLAQFAYSPELGRGYFLVINSFQSRVMSELRSVVEKHLIGSPPTVGENPSSEQNSTSLDMPLKKPHQWNGRFERVTQRFPVPESWQRGRFLEISETRSGLLVEYRGKRYLLVHVGGGLFRYARESQPSVAMIAQGDTVYFQGDWGNFIKVSEPPTSVESSSN